MKPALLAIDRALQLQPGADPAAELKAELLLRTDSQQAIKFLTEFGTQYPNAHDARYMLARLLLSENKPGLARDALCRAGFDVTVALDDRSAYSTLAREARSFTAVVTDINLGAGVTGFDVARRARQLNRDIKVIYISGQGPHSGLFSVPQALMLAKPYRPRELAEQIAAFIAA